MGKKLGGDGEDIYRPSCSRAYYLIDARAEAKMDHWPMVPSTQSVYNENCIGLAQIAGQL